MMEDTGPESPTLQ